MVLGGHDYQSGITHGLIQTYDVDQQRWSLEEETMSVALRCHSAFVMELPKSLKDKKSKSHTLTMQLLVKSIVMVVVSLGLAWCMYFVFCRLFSS